MSETKKRRGRPVGTDLKMDAIALEHVADRLIANPALKPMTAMKAVFDTGAFKGAGYQQRMTTVTRWQYKWKKAGEQALSEARRRADRKQSLPSPRPGFDHVLAFGSAYRPPEGLLRAIDQGAKASARFEKQFGPALERSRQMQKMAEAVERAAPLLSRSRSLEMLKAIPQMPQGAVEPSTRADQASYGIAHDEGDAGSAQEKD
jgi:hypothetical protein